MILACQNISKAFGTTEIIKNASFHIEEREKAALVGINGAGKSTILKSIARQLSLIAGTVRLDGEDMKSLTGAELSKKMAVVMTADEGEVILSKGKTMGYLAQHQDLTGHLSIYQEVLTAKQNLIDMLLKLFKIQRTVVLCRRKTKSIIYQRLLS